MARLKIEKIDEYEIYDVCKEFKVTVDGQEFKILKRNRTIRVLKKIDRDKEIPIYEELKGKEIGDLMKRLKPSNLGRRVPYIHFPSPTYIPPAPPISRDSDSPEDDNSESSSEDESLSVLYESEYNELFEGLDDSDW